MSISFEKAYSRVPLKDAEAVKNEIMQALKLKSRASWRNYLKGKTEARISQATAISEIFAKYGIDNVWEE